ncbi:conserved hypothetical protein [Lausannevirus]|uniref:Uncharacterized protein n=2 Tax=Lausannevirus TaxID=999883 RepID=A0A0N9P6Q4_9VIRU|nr:hypothetical protein LAU_0186 [Lausannevirus]AEA07037.1 conserved hypothetical protein [Lausannevirus]ALH06863.1 hypothetical protein PMV_165 [Port-miou virus]
METCLFSLGFKDQVIEQFLQKNPEFVLEQPTKKQVCKAAYKIIRQGFINRRTDVQRYEDIDSFLSDIIDIGFRQEFVAEQIGHYEYSECLAHRGPMHVAMDIVDNAILEIF